MSCAPVCVCVCMCVCVCVSAMENMNKPEQLQAITSRILQNLKNLQGTYVRIDIRALFLKINSVFSVQYFIVFRIV